MTVIAIVLAGILITAIAVIALMVIYGTTAAPLPFAPIGSAMAEVSTRDLPPMRRFTARDGQELTYRAYEADGTRAAILIHGQAMDGVTLHRAAKTLAEAGMSAFVPTIRGHGQDGRPGDIDYAGQLDDDLADFLTHLRETRPETDFSLVGHSAGGGFVIRIAQGSLSGLFERFVLLAPMLDSASPIFRPESGKWARPHVRRIVGLMLLDAFGIHRFEGLPILAFGVPAKSSAHFVPSYSYRLQKNFSAPDDYARKLGSILQPIALIAGGKDEILASDSYGSLLLPYRPDISIRIVANAGHMGVILVQEALAALTEALIGGNQPADESETFRAEETETADS